MVVVAASKLQHGEKVAALALPGMKQQQGQKQGCRHCRNIITHSYYMEPCMADILSLTARWGHIWQLHGAMHIGCIITNSYREACMTDTISLTAK